MMTRKQATQRRIGNATKALSARLARRPLAAVAAVLVLVGAFRPAWADDRIALWRDGQTACRLVLPSGDERAARLAQSTINDFTRRAFNAEIGPVAELTEAGTYVVLGTPKNNPTLAALMNKGLKLTTEEIGDEGFQILAHQSGPSRFVIVYGRTPRAIKHGCQELLFYRLAATAAQGDLDWPLNVVMKPAFGYRGIYMLPCWAPHDSLESWKRILRFNSELTLNRNWFWLDGFPVAGHPAITNIANQKSDVSKTDLAGDKNVRSLIDLVNGEDMRFLIGGGWMSWHHERAVGKDPVKAKDFYLAYLRTFQGVGGFYLEPTGEGSEVRDWRPECDSLREFMTALLRERPGFEFAIAIGKFNNAEYLKLMSQFDPKRVYWWWCWGDPYRDKAFDIFPSILRWHTVIQMSNYHGSIAPPLPSERTLAGLVTSYDPGMGFGNPWKGWGSLGADKPRDFDPYDMPYFGHEYFFRERCWDLELSEPAFVARLHRRLFDADCPAEAGERYWQLTQAVLRLNAGKKPETKELAPIAEFLETMRSRKVTPRTADTLARMADAMRHLTAPTTRR